VCVQTLLPVRCAVHAQCVSLHTGPIRRVIRSAGCRGARLLVWLILKDRVQPSFIAGVREGRVRFVICGLPQVGAAVACPDAKVICTVSRRFPFNTVCLPLSYSGNSGVNGVSYRGCQRETLGVDCRWFHHVLHPVAVDDGSRKPERAGKQAFPFDTACLPLGYSGIPGVNGVSYRGNAGARRSSSTTAPTRYCRSVHPPQWATKCGP